MKIRPLYLLCLCSLFLTVVDTFAAQANNPIRVLCWSELTEPLNVYPGGINGALSEFLSRQKNVIAQRANISEPEFGLSEETLNNTDVLIWFGHKKHNEIPDQIVSRVVRHIREKGMGFIALHSAHFSKPLKAALQASGSWSSYINFGKPEQLWVVSPKHPIANGVKDFTIPKTEIYTEPFDVPMPEAVIFEGTWQTGHRNREVMVWTLDKGRFVYIRPGHEEYPIFLMPEMQRVVLNSVLWAGKMTNAPTKLPRREVGPPTQIFSPHCNDFVRPIARKEVRAKYPESAKLKRIAGIVDLKVEIKADGSIGEITVLHGLPEGLTESAIDAVRHFDMTPALCGKKQVAVKILVQIGFELH